MRRRDRAQLAFGRQPVVNVATIFGGSLQSASLRQRPQNPQ